uniref:Uncharacterized protein n=1 Tax=Knipowitschia caucasica TaxID=637954 RepID=A0AAV2MLJ1_KNICA
MRTGAPAGSTSACAPGLPRDPRLHLHRGSTSASAPAPGLPRDPRLHAHRGSRGIYVCMRTGAPAGSTSASAPGIHVCICTCTGAPAGSTSESAPGLPRDLRLHAHRGSRGIHVCICTCTGAPAGSTSARAPGLPREPQHAHGDLFIYLLGGYRVLSVVYMHTGITSAQVPIE